MRLKDKSKDYQFGYAVGYAKGVRHKGRPVTRKPDLPLLYPWTVYRPGGQMFGSYETSAEAQRVASTIPGGTFMYEGDDAS